MASGLQIQGARGPFRAFIPYLERAMREQDVNPARRQARRAYEPSPVVREEHAEGEFTRLLEQQTAKLPSDFFLFSALAAMGATVALELAGQSRLSRFVGMWPQVLLTMGIYNKLVKMMRPR